MKYTAKRSLFKKFMEICTLAAQRYSPFPNSGRRLESDFLRTLSDRSLDVRKLGPDES